MEFKIIEGRTFDTLKQCLFELLERSKKLNPTSIKEEWLDNQDVCQLLGISLRTLQTYRDRKIIPYSQVAHKCYYKAKDIHLFIEKNKIKNSTK